MFLHNEIRITIFCGKKGDCLALLEDLEYNCNGKNFTIPAGFVCDGASIPEFLWASISPAIDPRTLDGALAHDFLYRTTSHPFTRKEADDLFYDHIRAHSLGLFPSLKAYFGVRLFGKKAWKKGGKGGKK